MKAALRRYGGLAARFRVLIGQMIEMSVVSLLIQAMGVVTAIIWLRILPIADYAAFGLCMTALGFLSLASDLGLTASINYFWREAQRTGEPFAERYRQIRQLRLYLFLIAGGAAAATLYYLLGKQGFDGPGRVILIALTLAACWMQVGYAMRLVVLRLGFELRRAWSADLAGSATRLGLAGIAWFFMIGKSFYPLASMTAGSIVAFGLAGRSAGLRAHHDARDAAPPTSMKPLFRFILPTIPATLMFSMQDPFIYWLATEQGGATVVAQTFAIGRIAAIFLIINSVMANVILPRIVNQADVRSAHRKGLVSIAVIALGCAAMIGLFALIPQVGTLIMGPRYANLGLETLIALVCASFQSIAQAMGQLNRSMGWVKLEPLMIAAHVVLALALAPFYDFSTTLGVMSFSLTLAAMGLAEMAFISTVNWLRPQQAGAE